MDGLRIAFFTDSYFPEIDGVTYTMKTWKQRLEERGHEVFIIYPGNSEYDPDENEIPLWSVPNPFYSGYKCAVPFGYRKIPEELDIAHCHGPGPVGRLGKRYANKKDIPKIYTHHTPLEEYFEQHLFSFHLANFLTKFYLPIENRFLSGFDKVTANTQKIDRKVESEKLTVGVDMEFFHSEKNSFIDDMDLERPIAGYAGRISMEKNISEICEFAGDFEGSVIIVGEGPKREEVEEKAGENVKVMDFLEREKLPEFYSGLDIFLTASTGDTLGLSTLEANACGTPVLAADTFPFEITIGERNGDRYEPGNVQEMREKAESVLEDSYNTREAVKEYSVEKSIERLIEIYSEVQSEYGNS